MKTKPIFLVLLSLVLLTCQKDIVLKGTPQCLVDKINQFRSGDKNASPNQIISYSYKGQVVYHIPAICCDGFGYLLDQDCNVICAPDGGITGGGDGRCSDFISTRTAAKVVWQDLR